MSDILVVGGSNVDYSGISVSPLLPRDSNIGKIEISFGGVGRNVTENLAYLGNRVTFITAIGSDAYGRMMKRELRELHVRTLSPTLPYSSSSYMAILGNKGDMSVAICDTTILDKVQPKDLLPFRKTIEMHHHILMDANFSSTIIDLFFKDFFSHKFYVEATSAAKVVRFRSYLKQIELFKSNALEARALLNENISTEEMVKKILNLGAKEVIITDGLNPIWFGEKKKVQKIDIIPETSVTSATGAGDALFAGVIHKLSRHAKLEDAIAFGIKTAHLSLQYDKAVNPAVAKLK